MRKYVNFTVLAGLIFTFSIVSAKDSTLEMKQALKLTQEMLEDPALRKNEIKKGPGQAQAAQKVRDVAGSPENEQAIYELASDVLATLYKIADGDPEKMMNLLNEGMKDPEKFAQQLSAEEQKKLSKIAQKIPEKSTVK